MFNTLRESIRSIFERILPLKSGPELMSNRKLLDVGKNSFHNGSFSVRGDQKVSIGSYCAFGKNITINTVNHDYNFLAMQGTIYKKMFDINHPGEDKFPPNIERTKGPVIIGSDVWIGDNVTILSGVSIGNGAIIGNGSIITKSVPNYCIVGGIPGKLLGKRYSEDKIIFINSLKWWEWTEDKIRDNKELFTSNLNKMDLEGINKILK